MMLRKCIINLNSCFMNRVLFLFPLMMVVSLIMLFFNLNWACIGFAFTFILAAIWGIIYAYFFNKEETACEIVYKVDGGLKVLPYLDGRMKNRIWGIKFGRKGLYREFGYAFELPNIDPTQVLMFSTESVAYQDLIKTIDKLYAYGKLPNRVEVPENVKEVYFYPFLPLE